MHNRHIALKRLVAFITPLLMWLILLFELDFMISKVYSDYDKSFGVLAINTNKSYYHPLEDINIELAVLDSTGSMVCDAELAVSIKDGNGTSVGELSTKDGSIFVNPDCQNKVGHQNPDFQSTIRLGNTGTYELILNAKTQQGESSTQKTIQVLEYIPLEIERKTFTRIFPLNTYRVDLVAQPNEDFVGQIKDFVPMDFEIIKSSLFLVQPSGNSTKSLTWNVDWKKGHTYELTYYYNAPDKSPGFFTLGPAEALKKQNILDKILNKDKKIPIESAPWQIASDDILNRYSTTCTSTGPKTWSNPTNASGIPNLSSSAVIGDFTTANSAIGTTGDGPTLNCSGFSSRDLGSFTSAQIIFSFAAAGAATGDDYVDVNYVVGGTTYDLTTIIQNATSKSNSTNGGYWSYSAPNITSWANLGNTTLQFDGVKVGGSDRRNAYVDSAWIEVTYTPRTYTQNDFKWYVTEDTVSLTNTWPFGSGDDLLENGALTQFPATNLPLAFGDRLRVQMNFTISGADLPITVEGYKLQYSLASDCTIATGWTDVGAKASASIWRLFDETSIGDSTTQANQLSTSNSGTEGYYSEINASGNNPTAVSTTQNTEWDWPIENNGALESTSYCFRMISFDGTAFGTYNSDGYPKLTTAPGSSSLMRHGNVFSSETEGGFFWAN